MVLIIVILAMSSLSMSLLGPMLPLYLADIGITPEIIGLMLSVSLLGTVFGESGWGWFADRFGLRLPFSIGTFVCGFSALLFILTRNIPAIFAIFFLWGITRSALIGPGRGYIGSHAPPLKKSTYMAIMAAFLSASRSLGALPSGFIADNWGYYWVFVVTGAVAFLAGIIAVTGVRNAGPPGAHFPVTAGITGTETVHPPSRFRFRPISLQCLVASLAFLSLGIFITFLPLLATQVVGTGATEVGVLFTVRGLFFMALAIPMGMLADRKGRKTLMIIGLLVQAGGMAAVAFAGSFVWLIAFTLLSGAGLTMFGPAALGLLSDTVPAQRQSTAMGLYGGICENVGLVAGSALGGFIWSAFGPASTFLCGTAASVIGAAICLGFMPAQPGVRPCQQ